MLTKNKAQEKPVDYALLHQQVREALLRAIPAPVDPATAIEVSSMIASAIDEIVSQCQHQPAHAETIIAGAVAGLSGALRSKVVGTRERMHLMRSNSAVTVVKNAAKLASVFAYTVHHVQGHAALGALPVSQMLSETDRIMLEGTLYDVFDDSTPFPPQVRFIQNEQGEWMLLVPLTPDAERTAVVPSSGLRMVNVSEDAAADLHINILSNPVPAYTVRADAQAGEVYFQRTRLVWSKAAIQAAIGADVSPEALSVRLQQDPALMQQLVMAHEQAQRLAFEAYLQEQETLKQCLPYEHMKYLPVSLRPELPDPSALYGTDLLAPALVGG